MDELPKQKKSFFRRELVYLVVVLIAAILVGIIAILRLTTSTPVLRSAGYVENLPKEQVRVGGFAEMDRYPLMDFVVESIQANANVFEGLTILRNGRVVPGLAESWTNPDPLTWKIKLRSGVKFHSGDSLKASDVKYTIEEAKKNESWVSNPMASRVEDVSVVNDTTVELKTKEPDPTLLHWLVYVGILSQEQVKQDGVENAAGTGPYRIDSFEKDKVVLAANSNYWAGQPKVKEIAYRQYKDNNALAAALEKGEVDIIPLTNKSSNEKLKEEGFQVKPFRLADLNFLGFDITNNKAKYVEGPKNPFLDLKVRKAILAALDISAVIKNSGRAGEPLSQFAVPELIGYNTSLPKSGRDLTAAKKLLVEAGYADGFTVTFDVEFLKKPEGEEIKKQLEEAGVKVKLNVIESIDDFYGKLFSGDFSFVLITYGVDTLDSTDLLNSFVHTPTASKGEANVSNYSNFDLDKLLDEASITFNLEERTEVMKNAHKKFMEQLPYIPLFTRLGFCAMKDDIAFKPVPLGYIFGFEISGRQKATETQ